jgi:hypothetical protein
MPIPMGEFGCSRSMARVLSVTARRLGVMITEESRGSSTANEHLESVPKRPDSFPPLPLETAEKERGRGIFVA